MAEIGYKMVVRKDPKMPTYPIEPNKTKLGFMGLVLALGMGAGLVIVATFMDRSFNSIDDIEKTLGVKVIGTLPVVDSDFFEIQQQRRIWVWVTILIVVVAGAAFVLFLLPRWQ